MDAKKNILFRTYLVFIGLVIFCLIVIGRIVYIQQVEGPRWIALSKKATIRSEELEAERGTIYSEDGLVLSTSVPVYDIVIDFRTEGLREEKGVLFQENLDSLSIGLANLFKDDGLSAAHYRKVLQKGYNNKEDYLVLKRRISHTQYAELLQLPLVRLGKYKSGFLTVKGIKRLNPFQMMAQRTIGIARDTFKVGLEKTYDAALCGISGKRLVRFIAGGTGLPIEGSEIEPKDGLDVVTTLDVGIQDAAQQALQAMVAGNDAQFGTCIVLEVKTGKVKAIANVGKVPDSLVAIWGRKYSEMQNYALMATEPGSTWKVVTLMSAFEDGKVNLGTSLDLEGGVWQYANEFIKDSETHGVRAATVQQAFEKSSNVGMAKIALLAYGSQPSAYLNHIRFWKMDVPTGIDLPGEKKTVIFSPGTSKWNNASLPWMAFGYNLAITPMHTAMFYNGIANGGKMMKPYLVNALLKDGLIEKQFSPTVVVEKMGSPQTMQQIKICLEGVVKQGTGSKLQTAAYNFAGKTGTSKVVDKGITYDDHVYQSSFAGYLPAKDPQYTIVVVIRNSKGAKLTYGAEVAGPVFRAVADKLYASYVKLSSVQSLVKDTVAQPYIGNPATLRNLASSLKLPFKDAAKQATVAALLVDNGRVSQLNSTQNIPNNLMPDLAGLGLKDAITICEKRGLLVQPKGKGKIISQSIVAGSYTANGQVIHLTLQPFINY